MSMLCLQLVVLPPSGQKSTNALFNYREYTEGGKRSSYFPHLLHLGLMNEYLTGFWFESEFNCLIIMIYTPQATYSQMLVGRVVRRRGW